MKNNPAAVYRQKLHYWWERLTRPENGVWEAEARWHSQFSASLFLGLFIFCLLMLPVPILVTPQVSEVYSQYVLLIGSSFVMLILWGMSRRGHYNRAARLLIAYGVPVIYLEAVVIGGNTGIQILYFWTAANLFASLFLSRWIVITALAAQMVGMLAMPLFSPGVTYRALLVGPFAFSPIATAHMLFLSLYRERLEKQRQARLGQSEQRYRDLFESSPVSLWEEDFTGVKRFLESLRRRSVTDVGRYFDDHVDELDACIAKIRVLDVNQATLRMYDAASKDQILGKTLPATRESRAVFHAEMVAIYQGKREFSGEGVGYTVTGKRMDLQVRWSVAPGCEDMSRVIVSVYDITETRKVEKQKLKRALEHELLLGISQFVLAVSHDFRTALANIVTSLYLIEKRLNITDRQQVQSRLDNIRYATDHLTEQLDNLHLVSTLSSQRFSPYDLNQVIESVIADVTPAAQRKSLCIEQTSAGDLLPVWGDVEEIRRALHHLLTNAINYTPPGGLIGVRLVRDDSGLIVEVRDTGTGIDAAQLPHIFDLFYRGDPSRQIEAGGVGIGLSIVRMIAEAHGGTITVASTPGQGSVFTLSLPIVPPIVKVLS